VDVALNWLWQGVVIALAASAILGVVPRARAQVRYCAIGAAGAAVLMLPVMTLLWLATAPLTDGTPPADTALFVVPWQWWTSGAIALALWAAWLIVYAARLGAAGVVLRHARREAQEFPRAVEARLPHWLQVQTTGRRATLMVSPHVRTAAVLGGGTPLIVVAPALIEQLSDADLDRVVIHEWAHVQRRDDLAQIAELCVCVVAGWHPALWWLQRRLHVEREVACDEFAVGVTGSPKAYATCLTTLATLPPAPVHWAPALSVVSSSSVRERIVRIVTLPRTALPRACRREAIAAALTVAAVAILVAKLQAVDTVFPLPTALRAVIGYRVRPALPEARAVSRIDDAERRANAHAMPREPAAASAQASSNDRASVPEAVAAELVRGESPLLRSAVEFPQVVVNGAPAETLTPVSAPARATSEAPAQASWSKAGDMGKAIGAGSTQAGAATARFFTRFGKNVARSF
jgi:beta-lactamase regulating signal transducer with metallopeptidase domain